MFPFFHKGKNQHTKNDKKKWHPELKPQKGQKVIRVHFKITEEVPDYYSLICIHTCWQHCVLQVIKSAMRPHISVTSQKAKAIFLPRTSPFICWTQCFLQNFAQASPSPRNIHVLCWANSLAVPLCVFLYYCIRIFCNFCFINTFSLNS